MVRLAGLQFVGEGHLLISARREFLLQRANQTLELGDYVLRLVFLLLAGGELLRQILDLALEVVLRRIALLLSAARVARPPPNFSFLLQPPRGKSGAPLRGRKRESDATPRFFTVVMSCLFVLGALRAADCTNTARGVQLRYAERRKAARRIDCARRGTSILVRLQLPNSGPGRPRPSRSEQIGP